VFELKRGLPAVQAESLFMPKPVDELHATIFVSIHGLDSSGLTPRYDIFKATVAAVLLCERPADLRLLPSFGLLPVKAQREG